MPYAPLAVGSRGDGTLICTSCGSTFDPETGRCADALAIEQRLIAMTAEALDRAVEQLRDQQALDLSRRRRGAIKHRNTVQQQHLR